MEPKSKQQSKKQDNTNTQAKPHEPSDDWGGFSIKAEESNNQSNKQQPKQSNKFYKDEQQKAYEKYECREESKGELLTDTQISGLQNKKPAQGNGGGYRELQKFNHFVPQDKDIDLSGPLDLYDDGKRVDQFKNKKTSYKEDLYTTQINYRNIDESKRQKAENIEREILGTNAYGNQHLAEERGQQEQRDNDDFRRNTNYHEEELYSGVIRENYGNYQKQNKQLSKSQTQWGQQRNLNTNNNTSTYKPDKKKSAKTGPNSNQGKSEKVQFIIQNKSSNINIVDQLWQQYVKIQEDEKQRPQTLIQEWQSATQDKELSQIQNQQALLETEIQNNQKSSSFKNESQPFFKSKTTVGQNPPQQLVEQNQPGQGWNNNMNNQRYYHNQSYYPSQRPVLYQQQDASQHINNHMNNFSNAPMNKT